MNDSREWPRLVMSFAIVAYFGWALIAHWSNGIEETLKSAFMIAVGYWLGSSKGSSDKAAILAGPLVPATAKDAAGEVADAAQRRADQIEGS